MQKNGIGYSCLSYPLKLSYRIDLQLLSVFAAKSHVEGKSQAIFYV